MIVGEPSLMGEEMDDEDERFITRIENNQFNPMPNTFSSPTYQQIPNSPSLIHQKMNFPPNSVPSTTTSIKREQVSITDSPMQQPLPSMFSNHSSTSNIIMTSINGDNIGGETRNYQTNSSSPQSSAINNQHQV